MVLMRYIPVVAAAVLLASPARADWMSGAQLQESCSGGAPVDRAMCLSYVMGVADGLRLAGMVVPSGFHSRGQATIRDRTVTE